MIQSFRQSIISLACLLFIAGIVSLAPSSAWAQKQGESCDNLQKNAKWNSMMTQLGKLISEKKWREALEVAKKMQQICDRTPILNYNIARIYKAMGNHEQYLFYLKIATDRTREFTIDWDLLDTIWSEKYIVAHPGSDPEEIAARNAELENLKKEVANLKSQHKDMGFTQQLEQEAVSRKFGFGMWTGVGFAGAGLAMGIAGGVLYATNDKPIRYFEKDNVAKSAVAKRTTASSILLGTGIGMFVAGAALTGIMAYYYVKAKSEEEPTLTFQVAPTGFDMTVRF